MPDDIKSETVRIIHFDDEMNTVSMIPNNLFYTYNAERRHWVVQNSVVRGKFVEQFELRPDSAHLVVVKYHLIDDAGNFRKKLKELMESPDLIPNAIAIFDLMRARAASNDMEPIGLDLYREAREQVGMASDRLFILSGFPRLFETKHPEVAFPHGQLLEKPFAAADLVRRIVGLLPEYIRF
jgi:hypothetical protein